MATVNDIFAYFEETVPTRMKMDFDNPGFLAGNGSHEVTRILLSLDITQEVICEAAQWGAQLIVSHHPMFFELKKVSTQDLNGRKVVSLLENGLSAICLHTNLDAVSGGVNDALMATLGADTEGILEYMGDGLDGQPYGMGRYGTVPERTLGEFLPLCKNALHANGLRYVDTGRPVHRIGVCGGSGGDLMHEAVKMGCDTMVTADVKHHVFLEAKELGINLIDAGHFSTENVVIPVLKELLEERFPEIETKISAIHAQPEQFFI